MWLSCFMISWYLAAAWSRPVYCSSHSRKTLLSDLLRVAFSRTRRIRSSSALSVMFLTMTRPFVIHTKVVYTTIV